MDDIPLIDPSQASIGGHIDAGELAAAKSAPKTPQVAPMTPQPGSSVAASPATPSKTPEPSPHQSQASQHSAHTPAASPQGGHTAPGGSPSPSPSPQPPHHRSPTPSYVTPASRLDSEQHTPSEQPRSGSEASVSSPTRGMPASAAAAPGAPFQSQFLAESGQLCLYVGLLCRAGAKRCPCFPRLVQTQRARQSRPALTSQWCAVTCKEGCCTGVRSCML